MEKKVNQEIRAKIMQLIHKELNEIGGENIFHKTDIYFGCPVYTYFPVIKKNADYSQKGEVTLLSYKLKFDDGEPDIYICTSSNIKETEEPYKTIRTWRKRVLFTSITEYSTLTNIKCGHISFNLTDEEHQDLIVKTDLAWKKYLSIKDEFLDNKVLDKINQRLIK